MILNNKNKKGFTIIEVIVACTIISISMFALMEIAQKGLTLSQFALKKSQASLLLEEGVEAVKSIRDNNWANISSLSLNTTYYLFFNNSTKNWVLNNSNVTSLNGYIPSYPIDSVFHRNVTINSVNRDINDDIVSSGGTLDPRSKKVDISVTWNSGGILNSKSISFYIFDIFN